MNELSQQADLNRRVLIVDDNRGIHDDYRKVLAKTNAPLQELVKAEAALFADAVGDPERVNFELTSAFQGKEAWELVKKAVEQQRPYALAFVDIRMPPGWDGLETAAHLWQTDPELQLVICTAFSDYTWNQIHQRIGQTDRLLILKKPFDSMELIQLASTLTQKWNLNRLAKSRFDDLEKIVAERTHELQKAYKDLKHSQERLLLQERLAAVGQLAAGVAHEFNNIMTVIRGYSSLLLSESGLPLEAIDGLQEIRKSAERAANLTHQLLTFSRKQVMRPRQLELNSVLDHMTGLLQRTAGEGIIIKIKHAREDLRFQGDLSMIEQLLINLVRNAHDAMPKGGSIEITTRLVRSEDQAPSCHPEARPGTFVELDISDAGCGMDTAVRTRLFTPFFTTKEIGQGVGMGLAVVYGIVKQHHGWIEVESELGLGSVFRLFLPAIAPPTASAADNAVNRTEPAPSLGGTSTIE
jgi:two-component system, NtrC family, sensor kinase